MFKLFKTKYRICKYYTTSVDKVSGETHICDQYYKVEYRNLISILFGRTWDTLTLKNFETYDAAQSYLLQYINDNYDKKEVHKKVIFEVEP